MVFLHFFFISIHAPREGSDQRGRSRHVPKKISIHAPREGSDPPVSGVATAGVRISIHAPREGSDTASAETAGQNFKKFQSTLPARGATCRLQLRPALSTFQSTLPARGATSMDVLGEIYIFNFNPRSPRGERRCIGIPARRNQCISIHAPREGSDSPAPFRWPCWTAFQSTLPARGATANVHRFLDKICTVCIKNRAFFAQCLIQTTSNAESVGKTRCYFGANLQAFIDSLYFALLQNQHFFWHIRGFASKMLYFVFVMVPKIIET